MAWVVSQRHNSGVGSYGEAGGGGGGERQVTMLLSNPYSVFPKLFALSLPGACSTILIKMQCKQERNTEKVSDANLKK